MRNEFDDILKKRWEEIHFPVDDQHRLDMINLLDQPKRRKGIFFWWVGGISMIAIGGLLLYNGLQTDLPSTITPSNSLPNEKSIENSSMQNAYKIDDVKNREPFSPNESNSASQPLPNASTNTLTNKIISEKGNETKTSNITIPNKVNQQNSIRSIKKSSTSFAGQISNTVVEKSEIIISQKELVAVKDKESVNVESHEHIIANEEATISEDRTEELPISFLAGIQSDLDYSREIIVLPIEPVSRMSHPVAMFAEAGFGLVPSSSPEIKTGWSAKAGGGLNYKLFPKTFIALSGGYLLQKDGFDFKRTSTVSTSGFGVRSNFHTLTPDKLHFVYSKFGIHQHIGRHIFSGGLGAQWLYGAQGTVVIQTQDQLPASSSSTSKYAWLSLDGMERLLWTGELSYGYKMTPRVSLELGIKYYFSSLEKVDLELTEEGYYWNGKFAPFNPSFTINYRFYGSK